MIKELGIAVEDFEKQKNFQMLVVFTFSALFAVSASYLTSIDNREISDADQVLASVLVPISGQEPVDDTKQIGMQPLAGFAVDTAKRQSEFVVNNVKKKVKKKQPFHLRVQKFASDMGELKQERNKARLENLANVPKSQMNDSDQRINDLLNE